jgi:prolyl oligopeptidase
MICRETSDCRQYEISIPDRSGVSFSGATAFRGRSEDEHTAHRRRRHGLRRIAAFGCLGCERPDCNTIEFSATAKCKSRQKERMMRTVYFWGFIMALSMQSGLVAGASRDVDGPPVAALGNVVEDYHGVKIADPYRAFENLSDPRTQAWIKGQNDYARRALSGIAVRNALLARIRELDEAAPYRISVIRRWPDGGLHYLKRLATENLDKLYYRDAAGHERLLVDPDRLPGATPERHFSISIVRPSPNGEFIAYGIAASGSEQTVLHVLDVDTGLDLGESIDRMEDAYSGPNWLADSSGFVYSRRRKLPSSTPETEIYKLTYSCVHRLGTDPEHDPVVFSNASASVVMTDEDFPAVILPEGSQFAIGQIKHGDSGELTLYAAPKEGLLTKPLAWKKVCDVQDEVEQFAVHGDDIFLLTAHRAPSYKIVRTSLMNPDFATAITVVPPGKASAKNLLVARDALYVNFLDRGRQTVGRLAFGSIELEMIDMPEGMDSGFAYAATSEIDGLFIGTTSWTRGGAIYAYDPASRTLADTKLQPAGKYDRIEGYTTTEVDAPSHDGVNVPLTILHKSGLKLDGTHPTLLNGYGAYGHSVTASFNPARIAWLERGGVLAFAHVRGGGDLGKTWHLAGKMATKPNTWKDFIACGEYLVRSGYTTQQKLAGEGGSAGGILIGRAITERPDLFGAAIIKVGCTDSLRMETTTNGIPNIQEFGTVKSQEGFKALLEMSALHHVADGVKYPAVLLTHGINDPRVAPWLSAKMTARLQAATASGKPVLFRVDYDAGHGMGSTKKQRQEQTADEWAFLLRQLGEVE